jgi:exopolyphosphatase/guanosine-5'-triphosphate,3'-diphosphate pyrophosphatase
MRPGERNDRSRHSDGAGGRAVLAALDLGTNNCRLLVAQPSEDGFEVIDSFSRIVRLGEGLSHSGELGAAAIERAIAALRICASKMRRRGVTHSRYVATEACRRAANCNAFIDRVADETGLKLEIISAEEEARLAVASCAPLLDSAQPFGLLFDIGGGSTEVVWLSTGGVPEIIGTVSLPCGVVGLSERHGCGAVTPAVYEAMIAEVALLLAPFETRHAIGAHVRDGAVQMLGTSGTVTTLAGIHMELPRYDRARVDGVHLAIEDAWSVADRLLTMGYEGLVAHPCILGARADFVIPGTAIVAAICRQWPVKRLRVADRGLREGILMDLVARAR